MKFEKLYEFKAGDDGIMDLLVVGDLLFSCGEDDHIRKWNLLNYALLSEVKAHDKDVRGILKTPRGILSYSEDGGIKEFDLNLSLKYEYPYHSGRVNDVVFIDEKRFVSASDDATVRIYSVNSNSFKERNFNIGDVESLLVHNGKIFIGGAKLVVCDPDLSTYSSYDNDYIYGIDGIYTDGNRIFLSRSMEKKLEIRDSSLNINSVIRMPSWINHMDFYRNYIFMAISNMIVVYDNDMKEILRNDFSESEISAFVFYDGSLIAGYDDGYVRIWKIYD